MALDSKEKPKYANIINNGVGVLDSALAGSLGSESQAVTILTAGAAGTLVRSLLINTDDTVALEVFIYEASADGTFIRPITCISVPAESGNNGVNRTVDALNVSGLQKDNVSKQFIQLAENNLLKAFVKADMTAGKKCYISAEGRNYEEE